MWVKEVKLTKEEKIIERKKLLGYHLEQIRLLRRLEVFGEEYDKWEKNPKIKKSVGRGCAICGGSVKKLESHHLFQSINSKREYDDIIIVCKDCHKKIHSKKRYEDFIRAKFLSRKNVD